MTLILACSEESEPWDFQSAFTRINQQLLSLCFQYELVLNPPFFVICSVPTSLDNVESVHLIFIMPCSFQVKSNAVRALGNFLRYTRTSSLGEGQKDTVVELATWNGV